MLAKYLRIWLGDAMRDFNDPFLPQAGCGEPFKESEPQGIIAPVGDAPCPCCGYITIPNGGDALAYICPVCMWEIDLFITNDTEPSDQNHGLSLAEARGNYLSFGAVKQELRSHCREPFTQEKPNFGCQAEVRTMPIIREAALEDFPEVYALLTYLEGEELDRSGVMQVYACNLNDRQVAYYLAFDGANAVGLVSLHIQSLLHHGARVAEIQELVVLLGYQGTGLGKRLFDTARELAVRAGCVSLEVSCNRKREGAYQFYLSRNMKDSHHKLCLPL